MTFFSTYKISFDFSRRRTAPQRTKCYRRRTISRKLHIKNFHYIPYKHTHVHARCSILLCNLFPIIIGHIDKSFSNIRSTCNQFFCMCICVYVYRYVSIYVSLSAYIKTILILLLNFGFCYSSYHYFYSKVFYVTFLLFDSQ